MRKKQLPLILLIIYSLCFIFSIPVVNNVSALGITYHFDFEGTTLNQGIIAGYPDSKNIFTSDVNGIGYSNFNVTNTSVHGGNRCFRINGGNTGWFNETYSNSLYITEISFYVRAENYTTVKYYFYNSTLGMVNGCFVHLEASFTDEDLFYYRNGTTKACIDSSFARDTSYHWIGFKIINTSGIIKYYTGINETIGIVNKTGLISGGYRIDRIFFYWSSPSKQYIDDIVYTLSDTYVISPNATIPEEYCGIDVSNYETQIGNLYSISSFLELNHKEVTTNYAIPMDTTLYGVGLVVDNAQYLEDSDVTHYNLTINGNTMGNPLCFSSHNNMYTTFYILYWDINLRILNSTVTFAFSHSTSNPQGKYWKIGHGINGEDLDNDGDSIFYSDQSFTYWSWQYIRLGGILIPFYLPNTVTSTSYPEDLGMTFWAGEIAQPIPPIIFNDTLGLSNWVYENDTGYIYTIPEVSAEGIVCSYTLSSPADDYGVWINFTDKFGNQECPYVSGEFPANTIPYPDGSLSMIPSLEGKYVFTLWANDREHPRANVTAWVIGNWSNETYYIYTNPPTTNQFENYGVVWKFHPPTANDGYVAMFDEFYKYSESGWYGKYTGWDIIDNINEKIQNYHSTGDSAEYWVLYINKSNGFYPVAPVHTHNIRLYGVLEDKIWALPNPLTITYGNIENRGVVIYYQHRHVGTDISVYINDQFYANVGNNASGTTNVYNPSIAGVYTITLQLDQNGTFITVATNTFTVAYEGTPNPNPPNELLPAPYSYIAGALITIMFMIVPVILIGKLSINSDVIKYVPVFSGMIGFILSCLVGFFPWYAIFGLVLILVLAIVILWQSQKS